jgi:hypothetical protein
LDVVYRLIVAKYPANLITVDAWGALPLLYAIWGDAPVEIIQLLINSYQSLYPDHEFDWTDMMITLGQANAPLDVIKKLLDIQHTLSPGYNIDWDQILEELAMATSTNEPFASLVTFCFLTRCSLPHVSVQLESSISEMTWQIIGWVTRTMIFILTETCGIMKCFQNLSIMNLSIRN